MNWVILEETKYLVKYLLATIGGLYLLMSSIVTVAGITNNPVQVVFAENVKFMYF